MSIQFQPAMPVKSVASAGRGSASMRTTPPSGTFFMPSTSSVMVQFTPVML